jgi:putative ABC transport system permease protein
LEIDMDNFLQDLRNGLKSLVKTPRLTLAALACIALGIAASVFMFTLVDGVLLRRPPFPDADRLARVRLVATEGEEGQGDISYLELQDFREQAKSFDVLEMAGRVRIPVTSGDGTERLRGEVVSPGYFGLLGIKAAKGRLFSPEEYAPNAGHVVLISDGLWKRKYGSNPQTVGQPLHVRGRSAELPDQLYTIIGIMPPGFIGTVDYDISEFWIPVAQSPYPPMLVTRTIHNVWPIVRRKPNVSFAAAKAEVEEIGQRLDRIYPNVYRGKAFHLEPFGETWRTDVRTGLVMLMAAAGLLLLVACVNIASLLLARLVQREHELTLRFVLGAKRGGILRRLLIESLLLSIIGGVVGTLLAFWGIKLFAATESINLPPYVSLSPDWNVVGLAVALVLFTGVLFGVLPAWFGSSINVSQNLREAGRGLSLGRRQRFSGQVLIVVEVMLTFVLVIAALLMIRTYLNLANCKVGYRTDHVARLAITLDGREFPGPQEQLNFAERAKEALGRYPGVRGVTFMAGILPPHDDTVADVVLDGVPNEALRQVFRHAVDPDFLNVFDIHVKWGRNVARADRQGTPQVALVSETLARFLAGGDGRGALGKRFQLIRDARTQELTDPFEIVGIVTDVLYMGPRSINEGLPTHFDIYVSMYQFPTQTLSTAVVTEKDPATMLPALQSELGRLAMTSPVHWVSTVDGDLRDEYTDVRFYTYLSVGYSICALLLAALGIYGVLANSVSRRFGELGIRMAVGAQGSDIVRLVLGQGMRTLLLGLVLGVGVAALGTRLIASILYGVAAGDPLTFVMVAAVMVAIGLAACYLPARQATRIDPVVVLREK